MKLKIKLLWSFVLGLFKNWERYKMGYQGGYQLVSGGIDPMMIRSSIANRKRLGVADEWDEGMLDFLNEYKEHYATTKPSV